MLQVGHGLGHAVEDPGLVEHDVGTRGGALGALAGPAIARRNQAHFRQAAIQHGARRHADILAKLRPHQDDRRRGALGSLPFRSPSHAAL